MDRKIVILGTGLVLLILLGGFFLFSQNKTEETAGEPTSVPAVNENPSETSTSSEANPTDVTINSKKLATNYFVFEKSEYEKAQAAHRPILLFFYANWCPTCARQEPINVTTFNNIDSTNLIAFRVNYSDSDTSKAEDDLAKELGITYQHKFRLFDSNGTLVNSFEGDTSESELKNKISKVS